MFRRAFNIVTLASTVLLAITIALWVMTFWLNPWDHYISLGSHFHISVWGNEHSIGRVVLFNSISYGPYRGSIINASAILSEAHFGDTAGIYFRYFRFHQGILWTLMLSLWYPLALFSIAPVSWLVLYRKDATRPGFCPKCRYDIRASVGFCPECGTQLDTESVDKTSDAPNS